MPLIGLLHSPGGVAMATGPREGSPSAMAPFDAPWGQRYAGVLDPDGYQVPLFAPL